MSVARNFPERQADMAQDVIRDEGELIADLMRDSVARDWDLPRLNDAGGVTSDWLRAFCAFRFADLIAQLETGLRLKQLSTEDRAWLKGQVEQLIADAETHFSQPLDDGANYQPHQEFDPVEQVKR